jgi:C1A family cysteine protease
MARVTHKGIPLHQRKWYGCRRDARDPRDHRFVAGGVELPAAVDLRADCPPVMDQGQLGSCTAHGITGALRFLLVKHGGPRDHTLSRLQLYYDERVVEGTVHDDSGAEIRTGIKVAAKIGVAHERLWHYNIRRFQSKPSANVYKDALKFEALEYQRVNVNTNDVKAALAGGHPVVIGVPLFESFESDEVARTGVIPMPDLSREQEIGGHCLYVVGYGQKQGYFTVRNSWNTDWGDKGDCYFPEDYLGSPDYGADYWVITAAGIPAAMKEAA